VVAEGASGDFAKPRTGWPSGSRLSRFHRTEIFPRRYKGQRQRRKSIIAGINRGKGEKAPASN
ncbi:hypothetical protein SAZ10_28365, partial [Mesorhizobium sp. BAC0120]|uniref:hypothetical protein n=1 Tax=Mesorhizobium sp. BAC0120 TaxID=3090670 RepID=UPI00298C781B